MRKKSPRSSVLIDAVDQHVTKPEDCWLGRKAVAALLDVSEKWLEALAEGRKDLEGPPFIKMGQARNAPVRYNLARLREWTKQFEEYTNVHGAKPQGYSDFGSFMANAGPKESWLFVQTPYYNCGIEFIEAINSGLLGARNFPVHWIPRECIGPDYWPLFKRPAA